MNSLQLEVSELRTGVDVDELNKRLGQYNQEQVGLEGAKGLTLVLRDEAGKMAAGLSGRTHCNWLYVRLLWVSDKYRGEGLGKSLMSEAENQALTRGCKFSHLDTYSFQALDFYKKQGYAVFGELANYPKEHTRFFLRKNLKL